MVAPSHINVAQTLSATILVTAALYFARDIAVPIAFALFIITLVWPLQAALEKRLSRLPALALTLTLIAGTIAGFGLLIFWSVGAIGRWIFQNAARFKELYNKLSQWLEAHGIFTADMLAEYFDTSFLLSSFQRATGHLHGLVSFCLVVLIFLMLGLLEIKTADRNLGVLSESTARKLRCAFAASATKIRRYMLVRAMMSIITGLAVFLFALAAGLELPLAWGSIAFALNFIPFIGSFIATVLPTAFAMAQSESWQTAAVVFICLNILQFIVGSYVEPRVAGSALSISPFLVLCSVFFWLFMWGIPGALIGVQITIAVLAICEQFASTEWLPKVLSDGAHQQ